MTEDCDRKPPFLCRFALVPVYLYGGFCILHSIRRTGAVFRLAYPALVAACLAPQLLLEFRYFILPFLFYRLQVRLKIIKALP